MLQSVMTYNRPKEWEDAIYEDKTYHTFELSNDGESNTITIPFNGLLVSSIKRVQNPFQLGRFIIRKEQKIFRNESADELVYYHPLNVSDLHTALEYNMDVRRYEHRYSGIQHDRKNPMFFKTPSAAFGALYECSHKVILVCKILGSRQNEPGVTFKRNDSEYMPTYVVFLEK